ncbi:hypothetical protein JHW43_000325 [Diplocarpon mali]|nr:hypothetical protein JHW43_000325 [Diplocarpon mali]
MQSILLHALIAASALPLYRSSTRPWHMTGKSYLLLHIGSLTTVFAGLVGRLAWSSRQRLTAIAHRPVEAKGPDAGTVGNLPTPGCAAATASRISYGTSRECMVVGSAEADSIIDRREDGDLRRPHHPNRRGHDIELVPVNTALRAGLLTLSLGPPPLRSSAPPPLRLSARVRPASSPPLLRPISSPSTAISSLSPPARHLCLPNSPCGLQMS